MEFVLTFYPPFLPKQTNKKPLKSMKKKLNQKKFKMEEFFPGRFFPRGGNFLNLAEPEPC